ncbi:putative baseplate assembly protein [Heliobacterium mobile]|nr:putative baseplate assembly protein [Heliobacterium mobile]
MLHVPDLDDRTFEQMVDQGCRKIPALYPAWTDENYHDPGITLVELLAWLVEMQQYYLDRITPKHEQKMLKLLGVAQKEAAVAHTSVLISWKSKQPLTDSLSNGWVLPRGTPFLAEDVRFESQKSAPLVKAKLTKVIVHPAGAKANDVTVHNDHPGIPYYAFGPQAQQGSILYLGFDSPLPFTEEIEIIIKRHLEKIADSMEKDEEAYGAPSKLLWSSGRKETSQVIAWAPLEVVADHTHGFNHSGALILRLGQEMSAHVLPEAGDDILRYWLRCMVVDELESVPRFEQISLNTVPVAHCETLSTYVTFLSTGQPDQRFALQEYLAYKGQVDVQVQTADGAWQSWKEKQSLDYVGDDVPAYAIVKDDAGRRQIRFGNGREGRIPPAGRQIRVILCQKDFYESCFIGRTNGLACQFFYVEKIERQNLIKKSFQLQVARLDRDGTWCWEDWHRVDNLDASSPEDKHYAISDSGVIQFGDGERGKIPSAFPRIEMNIRIISCQIGGGKAGNVKAHQITRFDQPLAGWQHLQVTNPYGAKGGADKETLEQAKVRLLNELHKPTRAVTAEDYEEIVRAIPDLSVAKVKGLPLYREGLKNYPVNRVHGLMTIVVVPQSNRPDHCPMPSDKYLKRVRNHLEPYRLITTELHVIAPVYIKVTVAAQVMVEATTLPHRIDEEIKDMLKELLRPFDGERRQEGWQFGRAVYLSDIMSAINRMKEVAFVTDLQLHAEGPGAVKNGEGDILIPPHGLVFSENHEIQIKFR